MCEVQGNLIKLLRVTVKIISMLKAQQTGGLQVPTTEKLAAGNAELAALLGLMILLRTRGEVLWVAAASGIRTGIHCAQCES